MEKFLAITFLLGIIQLLYFRVANRFNIIDKPNERSSHNYITIRGGGIIFPLAALTWFVFSGFEQYWIIGAALLLSAVSFMDDIMTLSNRLRSGVQVLAVSILFWQLQVFGLPWYVVVVAYILTIGWINGCNFMDGINGITAFYGLAGLFTFLWLENNISFETDLTSLILFLIISVLVFTFFNARTRAKTFAGDVGSISLAFFLAWFLIRLMIETGRYEYILLVVVYGIDTSATIFFRLLRRENIFKPHRSHLYQYLANELKIPHLAVSALYAISQGIISFITILLIKNELMTIGVFYLIVITLSLFYLILRLLIQRKLNLVIKSC